MSIINKIIIDFFRVGCSIKAAFLAYITLLSLVPLTVLGLNILTIFPFFSGLEEKIQHFVFNNFVASSAHIVLTYVNNFIAQTKQLSILGIIFLVIASVFMIFSIEKIFNQIWRAPKHRNILHAIIVYLAVLIFAPILLGFGFAVSSYLMTIKLFFKVITISGMGKIIFLIFPYLFTFLAFILLYIIVPNCKIKLGHAAIGAVMATVLFELSKYGLAVYLKVFPFYQLVYGAFAIIPIFLLWLYLSWLIVLFGAVVCHNIGKNVPNIILN